MFQFNAWSIVMINQSRYWGESKHHAPQLKSHNLVTSFPGSRPWERGWQFSYSRENLSLIWRKLLEYRWKHIARIFKDGGLMRSGKDKNVQYKQT
jgi:hypothetical protein